MKNSFFFRTMMTSVVMVAIVVFSSCGSKSDYKGAIPADAPVVVEIDMQSLTLKSNILSYKDMVADMLEGSAPANDLIMKFADELRKADDGGMNFNTPVYFFTVPQLDGWFIVTAVKRKQEVLDLLLSIRQMNISIIEDESQGVSWLETDRTRIGVLTDEMLLVGVTEQPDLFMQLMKCNGGFFDSKMGKALISHNGDITLMLNVPAMSDKAQRQLEKFLRKAWNEIPGDASMPANVMQEVRKLQIVTNIRFLKGQIVLNLFDASDKDTPEIFQPITAEVFDHVPSQGLMALVAIGLDGQKTSTYLNDELNANAASIPNDMRVGLRMVSNFIKDMNGTTVLAVTEDNFSNKPGIIGWLPIPQKRSEFIVNLLQQQAGLSICLTGDESYSVLSNLPSYRYNAVKQPFNMADRAASSLVYVYFDVNRLLNKVLEEKRRVIAPDRLKLFEAFVEYVNNLDFAEMKMDNYKEVSFILTLKDNTRNSLDLLITGAFELGMKFYIYEGQHGRELHAVSAPDVDPFEEEWEALIDWEPVEEVVW